MIIRDYFNQLLARLTSNATNCHSPRSYAQGLKAKYALQSTIIGKQKKIYRLFWMIYITSYFFNLNMKLFFEVNNTCFAQNFPMMTNYIPWLLVAKIGIKGECFWYLWKDEDQNIHLWFKFYHPGCISGAEFNLIIVSFCNKLLHIQRLRLLVKVILYHLNIRWRWPQNDSLIQVSHSRSKIQ